MNHEELVQAMKPGAKNPMDERSEKDLGRFGLGLKTASFSQCQKLIVLSKKAGFAPIYWIICSKNLPFAISLEFNVFVGMIRSKSVHMTRVPDFNSSSACKNMSGIG